MIELISSSTPSKCIKPIRSVRESFEGTITQSAKAIASRIKVGVGEKPQGWDLADHVLGRFSSEDRAKVEEAIGHAMDAAVLMMQGETDKAMNTYN